jgi:hypothetical protein
MPHRLTELAVAWNVDTKIGLVMYNVHNGRAELRHEARLIDRLARLSCVIRRDECVGARQAAGVTGQYMIAAMSHGCTIGRTLLSR